VNPTTEFVRASKGQSPIHEFVADHGRPVDRSDLEHVRIAGRPVTVSKELTESERGLVSEAIAATEPRTKACWANALKMWEYDSRFKYTDGYAGAFDIDVGGLEHAWCMLDGEKLVDVTTEFDHYHGAIIEDVDTLRRHVDKPMETHGVLRDHGNRYRYLQKRGYLEA
jgi:hypothetical protein